MLTRSADQHQRVAQVVLRQLVGQGPDGVRQPLGRLGRAEDRGDARPLGRENTNDCRSLAQVKRELELCKFCIAEIDRNFSVSRKARFAESRAGLQKLSRHAHGSPSFAANAGSKRRQQTAMLDVQLGSATPKLLKRIGRRPRKKELHVVIQMSPPAGTIVAAMKLKILVACSLLHDVPRIRAPGSKFVRWLLNRASHKFTSKRM